MSNAIEFGGALNTIEFNGVEYDARHGGPFDRGSADSYYHRPINPHYWPEGTGHGEKIEKAYMTDLEVSAYMAGYEFNEQFGNKKDFG